ncbi:hypothetical protein, partial [Streptomyces sp. NPDC055085]
MRRRTILPTNVGISSLLESVASPKVGQEIGVCGWPVASTQLPRLVWTLVDLLFGLKPEDSGLLDLLLCRYAARAWVGIPWLPVS